MAGDEFLTLVLLLLLPAWKAPGSAQLRGVPNICDQQGAHIAFRTQEPALVWQ